MRTLALALAAICLLSGPAAAQAPKPKYTLDTPIHVLMEDPKMLAWLDKHFPGLSERMRDPEVGTIFAGVSIQGLSIDPDHGRALTPAVMEKLAASLEKAQAEPAASPPPS
jgi:hypothetical protein